MIRDFDVGDWAATEDTNTLSSKLFQKYAKAQKKKKSLPKQVHGEDITPISPKNRKRKQEKVRENETDEAVKKKKAKVRKDKSNGVPNTGNQVGGTKTTDLQINEEEKNSERKKRKKKKKSNKKNKYAHLVQKTGASEIDTAKSDASITRHNLELNGSVQQQEKEINVSHSSPVPVGCEIKDSSAVKRKRKNKQCSDIVPKSRKSHDNDLVQNQTLKEADVIGKDKKKKKLKSNKNLIEGNSVESLNDIVRNRTDLSKSQKPKNSKTDSNLRKQPVLNSENKNILMDSHPEKAGQYSNKKNKLLLQRMSEQLNAARFRYLNEKLYNQRGSESMAMFKNDREAFSVYHDGFSSQVAKWPVNPINVIIQHIKSLPRNFVVADFGCGDAKLAQALNNKVFSFDLVAVNSHVTVCDISKVPLKNASVDVAVFCLALMGTNMVQYLKEAHRVLKDGGLLKIAEVCSRFSDVTKFMKSMNQLGFKLCKKDTENKMFWLFDFKKAGRIKEEPMSMFLDPCTYKKR